MTADMPTIPNTLDALRHMTGSDSASAAAIGLTRQDVYLARKRRTLPDRAIIAAAVALAISPQYLLAALHADSTSDPTAKQVWLDMASALRPSPACSPPLYYVKSEGEKNDDHPDCEKSQCDTIPADPAAYTEKRLHFIPLSDEKKKALEVLQWCIAVGRIPPDSPLLSYYVSRWNVPAKIAAARAAGTLADTLKDCPTIDLRHIPAALAAIAESDTYNPTPRRTEILPSAAELRLQA